MFIIFFPSSNSIKNDEEYLVSSDSRMVMIDHDLSVKNCNENKTGKGYDYRGCQNKTKSGYLCAISCANGVKGTKSNSYGRQNRQC